jgi:hypothetical protein
LGELSFGRSGVAGSRRNVTRKLRSIMRILRSIMRRLPWLNRWVPAVGRSSALQQEIGFWREWFVTGGLQWPQDFQNRSNPDQPIQDHLAQYISRLEIDRVHILDVGAGPLTKVGKKHPSKQLIITAMTYWRTSMIAC